MHEFFARSCGLRKMKAEISRIGKNFEARFSPPICTKSQAVCTRFTGRFLFNLICPKFKMVTHLSGRHIREELLRLIAIPYTILLLRCILIDLHCGQN